MTAQELGARFKEQFGASIIDAASPRPDRLTVRIAPDAVANVATWLYRELSCRYAIGVGTDRRPKTGRYQVSHFFSKDADRIFITVHADVDPDDAKIASITPTVPAASWAEREIRDMIGVVPVGHPDPRRLVLADDWPEDLYPLRYDVDPSIKPPITEKCAVPRKPQPEGTSVVPIGPFYPALEEPAYFRVFVEGETVAGADYRGFYSHRGIEKLGCSVLTYNQVPFLAERICGICGCVHSTAYCQIVEQAAGIEIPLRARYIRTLMLELERLESHLLWMGIAGHILGFDTVLMQVWRMREPLMWLCEKLTGNRKTYANNIIGGIRRDIPADAFDDIIRVVNEIEREWKALYDAVPGDTTLLARLKGTGVLPKEMAIEHGAVGPTARGSGIAIDARIDYPYAAYDRFEFEKVVEDGCDNLARTMVRMRETLVSCELIRNALAEMPDGPVSTTIEENIPAGREALSVVEAPRGEAFHWALTGENNRPERWRVRAPSYANLQVVPDMITGDEIADVPIDIASFDPCYSCTDRMEVLDGRTGQIEIVNGRELSARKKMSQICSRLKV